MPWEPTLSPQRSPGLGTIGLFFYLPGDHLPKVGPVVLHRHSTGREMRSYSQHCLLSPPSSEMLVCPSPCSSDRGGSWVLLIRLHFSELGNCFCLSSNSPLSCASQILSLGLDGSPAILHLHCPRLAPIHQPVTQNTEPGLEGPDLARLLSACAQAP